MGIKQDADLARRTPGGRVVKVESGQPFLVVIDERHTVKDGKWGTKAVPCLACFDFNQGVIPVWQGTTLYMRQDELDGLAQLLTEGKRTVLEACYSHEPINDKNGEQKTGKDGAPLFKRVLLFSGPECESDFSANAANSYALPPSVDLNSNLPQQPKPQINRPR